MLTVDSAPSLRVYSALAALVPAPRRGHRLFARALASTSADALPTQRDDVLRFVRGPVRHVLEDELGDRLAGRISAEMEQTVARELTPPSDRRERRDTQPATPSSRRLQAVVGALAAASPSVVTLVHHDAVRSATLARGLLRARFLVNVGPSLEERLEPAPNAVIVSEPIALDLPFALRRFFLLHPEAALVACDCSDPEGTERALRQANVRRIGIVASGAPSTQLLAAAKAVTDQDDDA